MKLKKPEMIFFDFGGTLCDDKGFSVEAAGRAMYACAKNPEVCSEEEAVRVWSEIFNVSVQRPVQEGEPMEIPQMAMMVRCALDICGLKTDLSPTELETAVQWQGRPYPMVADSDRLLRRIAQLGIRTAVISNFSISSATLSGRIGAMFPENRFEFIITSSDYAFCKPNRRFFSAALGRAGVRAENCWYLGDSLTADVAGAKGCGMFPVHINRKAEAPAVMLEDHLQVNSWAALLQLMEQF